MLTAVVLTRKRVDFCLAITEGACVAAGAERMRAVPLEAPAEPAAARDSLAALGLALVAGALLAIRLDAPAFFDNEGRYAEVAREMVVLRDWVTPHIDFTPFLNKPPLTFWLAALVFQVGGVDEWARLVSIGAAVVTLFATCRLGALLYGPAAGFIAGLMLATTLGFALEARTLRPDMIVVAATTVALLCWWRADTDEARRTRWLVGLYAALGVGILAKGLVPVVLAGLPIAALTLPREGWRGVLRLRPALGLLVMGAIVLPWHLAAAARNPGFAWDYVVNQHLLFFLDRKEPRDSEGDPLLFFWAAFAGRAVPWILLVPFTLREALRVSDPARRATVFPWAWTGGLLLFFSCAPSRLEHYSLPALPAVALLAARSWEQARRGALGQAAWWGLALAGALMALVGLVGAMVGRGLLARTYWLADMPVLLDLVLPAAVVVGVAGVVLAWAARRRRADVLVGGLALCMVPLVAIVLRAEMVAEPLFSWRPAARALMAGVPATTEIVFEAPVEYQQVGGLVFYTGRRVTLIEPPGFVPPTYLRSRVASMFVPRAAFETRWRTGEPLVVVSDPQRRRDQPDGLVPAPFRVVGRFGDRWVLTNVPAGAR
jgi:4-amino-4-deoxy-L-arabinose transferase-like glycosyltransferase